MKLGEVIDILNDMYEQMGDVEVRLAKDDGSFKVVALYHEVYNPVRVTGNERSVEAYVVFEAGDNDIPYRGVMQ